jgi:DNA-binding transcriptional MerR regulator
MVRKRSRYTRARDRLRRPKHPAPRDGFLLSDVARLTAVPVRTLRDYVQRGLLHYSERRGTLTRYPRIEVLRLLGALRLKTQTRATWAAVKRQLDTLSALELERWLVGQGLGSRIAVELGIAPLAISAAPHPEGLNVPSVERAATFWQHTELLPGLELFLNASAGPEAIRAAQQIIDEHARR